MIVPDDGSSQPVKDTASSQAPRDWRDRARDQVETLLPGITSDDIYPLPKARQFLAETWEACKSEIEVLPIPAITAKASCRGCGDCVAICPQEALTKKELSGPMILIYEPLKCVRCQRCIMICRSKALSMEIKALSYRLFMGKVLLHPS